MQLKFEFKKLEFYIDVTWERLQLIATLLQYKNGHVTKKNPSCPLENDHVEFKIAVFNFENRQATIIKESKKCHVTL